MTARELVHTAEFTYVRFHYGRGRDGSYSDAQLDEWVERIARWRRRVDVYAYFNNDWAGHAVRNALGLRSRLERSVSRSSRATRRGNRRGS